MAQAGSSRRDTRNELSEGRGPAGASAGTRDRGTVLIVEDDPNIREVEEEILARSSFRSEGVGSAEEALLLVSHRSHEVILLDLTLKSAMSGLELLEKLHDICSDTPIVVVTGDTELRTAVQCIRRGAFDFLTKPLDPELLSVTVEKAAEHGEMASRLANLEQASGEAVGLGKLLGRGPRMKRVFAMIRRAAPHNSPVLILGESGCGKELAAREIHRLSPRAAAPLITVSLANVQASLQESEFFGHEKGAFTGADAARRGMFEEANGGTIFLDEVAECSPSTQAALLRVLQEGEIRRVGSNKPNKIDVRVIAATNANLEKFTASGQFRSDLFYRLGRVVIEMPPLRDRPEDIVMLAETLLARAGERLGRPDRRYSPRALQMLMAHRWPGNVREMENLSEKVALFTDRAIVRPADLQALDGWTWSSPSSVETLEAVERRHIQEVLGLTRQNYKQAANLLGIPRSTLYRKVRRLNLGEIPEAEVAAIGAGGAQDSDD